MIDHLLFLLGQPLLMWDGIAEHINRAIETTFTIDSYRSVGGGSINRAYCLQGQEQQFFLKLNQASKVAMFEAEASGLNEMADTQTILVPRAVCWGVDGSDSYIVLEWLELDRGASNWHQLGQNLARLHQHTSHQGFGWHRRNTIGDTPQINDWSDEWADFYVTSRLKYQFNLAQRRGGSLKDADELIERVPDILMGHCPKASLVHGDLWAGNAAFTPTGEPVIFDPATYYGDREVDIAMTELFGGFPQAFYQGYESVYPLDSGYQRRKTLYNLYHILNHFNLFGGSYKSQAERMIQQLIRSFN